LLGLLFGATSMRASCKVLHVASEHKKLHRWWLAEQVKAQGLFALHKNLDFTLWGHIGTI